MKYTDSRIQYAMADIVARLRDDKENYFYGVLFNDVVSFHRSYIAIVLVHKAYNGTTSKVIDTRTYTVDKYTKCLAFIDKETGELYDNASAFAVSGDWCNADPSRAELTDWNVFLNDASDYMDEYGRIINIDKEWYIDTIES